MLVGFKDKTNSTPNDHSTAKMITLTFTMWEKLNPKHIPLKWRLFMAMNRGGKVKVKVWSSHMVNPLFA